MPGCTAARLITLLRLFGLLCQLIDPGNGSRGSSLGPQLNSFLCVTLLLSQALGVLPAFLKQRTRTAGLAHCLDLPAFSLERLELGDKRNVRRRRAGHRHHGDDPLHRLTNLCLHTLRSYACAVPLRPTETAVTHRPSVTPHLCRALS